MCRTHWSRRAAGFTLVELLVVVIIIAIIAGILLPTLNAARRRVLIARVTTELKQLETAIEQYKTDHGGDYPPDFTDFPVNTKATNVRQHLARAFARHNRAAIDKWLASTPATQKPVDLDPAEALVFWLSMLRNDAVFPLTDSSGNNVPLTPTAGKKGFDFDPVRLRDRDGDGWPEYYPKGVDEAPFVYFHNKTYLGAYYPLPTPASSGPPIGTARPYAENVVSGNPIFFAPTKYQIISSGLDNDFGLDTVANPPNQPKIAPSSNIPQGTNLDKRDFDNLTSFSEGKTIEGMKP